LVGTLQALTEGAALPSATVTLAVLLQTLALPAGAFPHLFLLLLQQPFVFSVDFPLLCVVAILATAEPIGTDESHLQAVTVVLLAFGAPAVAALTVEVHPLYHHLLGGGLQISLHLVNGMRK
jgi:hypothetical protein